MNLPNFLVRIDTLLRLVEEIIIACCVITISFVTIGNAISRNLFNHSWVFVDEICMISLIIATFMGTGYAARKGRHIRMSALYDLFGEKIRKIMIIVISLVSSSVMILLTIHAIRYAFRMYELNYTYIVLNIPVYLVIIFVAFGFLIAGIEYVLAIYRNLTNKDVYLSSEVKDVYEVEDNIYESTDKRNTSLGV